MQSAWISSPRRAAAPARGRLGRHHRSSSLSPAVSSAGLGAARRTATTFQRMPRGHERVGRAGQPQRRRLQQVDRFCPPPPAGRRTGRQGRRDHPLPVVRGLGSCCVQPRADARRQPLCPRSRSSGHHRRTRALCRRPERRAGGAHLRAADASARGRHLRLHDPDAGDAPADADLRIPFRRDRGPARHAPAPLHRRARIDGIGVPQDGIVVNQRYVPGGILFTPAFEDAHPQLQTAYWGAMVRLRPGADVDTFTRPRAGARSERVSRLPARLGGRRRGPRPRPIPRCWPSCSSPASSRCSAWW